MPEISRPEARINYQHTQGNGNTPLLFLNSLGTDFTMWDKVIAELGNRWPILRMDTRGHGGSWCGGPDATIGMLAGDSLAVMDAAGVERATIVGLSLGGLIAQQIALSHPGRVAGLVLCATSSAFRPADMWIDRKTRSLAEGSTVFEEPSRARWFTEPFLSGDPETAARLVAMVGQTSDFGYAAGCDALARTDLTEALSAIRMPTLLISGEQDLATPTAGHELIASRIPGARLETLSPAAHMLAVEQPAATARLVAEMAAASG